jgi:hypothetical protein
MASRPEACRPVDVQGALCLDSPDGRTLNLAADGEHLRLTLSGWRDLRSLLRFLPRRRRNLRALADAFASHGLTFSIESAGTSVFRLGKDTAPNWLSRLLGLSPARIPFSALRLLFQR